MTPIGQEAQPRTPTGYKVAPQSYASLEKAAQDLHPLLPKEAGSLFIIDGWRLLEQTLAKAGYNPHVMEDEELDDCAAFTIPSEGLVVLRKSVYEGLFRGSVFSRSTVVHELAHIVLRHDVTMHRGALLGAHRFFEDSEWQAKAMTAAVMMPIDACKKAMTAANLAELCGTSIESAGYRLERLQKAGMLRG